jgi:zinc protease
MPNPQSVVHFGFQGLKRKDPDFIPAYILNYVVGGGGFSSKLMQEVREKRGLAYSVYTYLYPLDYVGVFAGGVATENKSVGQSLDLIKEELDRAAKEGLTEKELRTAKDYLIGSFALRFDTSSKIAAQLLAIQLDDLGIDYIDRRNGEIEAVTVGDIKRVARRLMEPKNLIVTVVGEPEGIKEAGL